MNKRITSVLVAIVMVVSAFMTSLPVYAASTDNGISISKETIYSDETFQVTVAIPPIAELLSNIEIRVQFDNTAFEITEYEPVKAEGVGTLMYSTPEEANRAGLFTVTQDGQFVGNDIDISESGYSITATFQVKEGAPAKEYAFNVIAFDVNSLEEDGYTPIDRLPEGTVTQASLTLQNRPVSVEGVTIDETMSIAIGESKTPNYTVSPDDATNPKVTFSAEEGKENVATVNPATGEVTGVGLGTMYVTVTTEDGGFSDTCAVTVSCPGHTGDEGNTKDCLHQATCEICHQPYGELGDHHLDLVPAVNAVHTQTELKPSVTEHYECSVCGKLFTDAAGQNETTLEELTGETPVHVYDQQNADPSALKTSANCGNDAVYYYTCSCGKVGTETWTDEGTATGAHQYTQTDSDETYHWKYCEVCGQIEEPKTPHTDANGKWEYDEANHYHTCGCGTIIDVTAHTFDQEIQTVDALKQAASCNTDAQYYYSCVCGAISKTDYFTADGTATGSHVDADGDWEYDGANHYHTCACGTKFDIAEHSGDQGNTKNCLSQATCEVCGQKYGELGDHTLDFVPAAGAVHTKDELKAAVDEHYECSVCGKLFTDAAGQNETTLDELTGEVPVHVYDQKSKDPSALKTAANCGNDAVYYYTCSCGKVGTETWTDEGTATGAHQYTQTDSDETYHWKYCEVCGQIEEPKTPHTDANGKWEYDEDNHYHTCGCGTIIDVTKHTFDQEVQSADTLKQEETCGADAEYYYSCVCGAISKTDYFTVDGTATGKHVDADGKWEYDGTEHYHTCSVCGTKFDNTTHVFDQTSIKDQSTLKQAATCVTDAQYYYTCECGAVSDTLFYESIGTATGIHVDADGKWESDNDNHWHTCDCGLELDKAPHEYKEILTESALKDAATCETNAVYYKNCECGKLSTDTFEAEDTATGHTASEWTKVDENTHQRICTVCEEILETGKHEYEIIGQKEATENEKGYTGDKVCKLCGYVAETGTEIPALEQNETTDQPKTDDNNSLAIWMVAIAISSILGMSVIAVGKRKRKN